MPNPIYEDALNNIILTENNRYITIMNWIKKQIKASKNGFIKLDASDIKNALGPDFSKKKDSTIHQALRYVMSKHNIKVTIKKKDGVDGGLILIMTHKLAPKVRKRGWRF